MIWLAAVPITALLVWLVTVGARVRRLKRAHRRIMNSPVTRWLPPEAMTPLTSAVPDVKAVDWQAISNEVDADGVYLIDYDAIGQRGVHGKRRNPANIAQFGIKRARDYLETGRERDLLLALRQFDHLARDARPLRAGETGAVTWCADFDLSYQYNARAPWKSAYLHRYAMAAMVWAHALTGDQHYLDIAERSLAAFETPTADGGLAWRVLDDALFFEEVVAEPLQHILNGHMTALVGLFRYAELTGSQVAQRICEQGVRGLLAVLPRYDRFGYSLYSLNTNPGISNHFNIANSSYHHNHIAQLRTIVDFTGEPALDAYATRWAARSGGLFDIAWTALFVMFKDGMKLAKLVLRGR